MRRRTPARAAAATFVAALALLALANPASIAQNDAEPRTEALAKSLVAEAEALARAGDQDAALLRALTALALDDDSEPARTALRLALTAAPGDDHLNDDDDGAVAPASTPSASGLRLRIDRLEQRLQRTEAEVDQQESRIKRIDSALDDDGRAEPLTRRLELTVDDLLREVRRLSDEVSRSGREITRLQSDLRRLESRAR